jgi:hypothetical protein
MDGGRTVRHPPAQFGRGAEEQMVRAVQLAIVAAFLVATSIALSPGALASHNWGKYHWARTANPLVLQTGDNVDNTANASWQTHFTAAAADWSVSTVLDLSVVPGSTTGTTCAAKSGTVQVCNANYGANGWLGLAQIWITRGSHIAQGVAKMNDYYWTPEANYAFANEMEAKHVMCQEVGHTFGLGHTSEDGSSQNTCMDYYRNTSDTDTTSTTPNAHDYEQLASIYKHLDRFNTAASDSTAGAPVVFVGGHAPDGTPHGATPAQGRWYAQDLGNGRFVITHVNWK